MNCDVIKGSIIHGVQQPILCGFHLDKPPGYKFFCEPETIKKIDKCVLITITFYLENDDHEEIILMEKRWTLR